MRFRLTGAVCMGESLLLDSEIGLEIGLGDLLVGHAMEAAVDLDLDKALPEALEGPGPVLPGHRLARLHRSIGLHMGLLPGEALEVGRPAKRPVDTRRADLQVIGRSD